MAKGRTSLALALAVVVGVTMIGAPVEGTVLLDHIVGGRLGWTFPPNVTYYQDWAANKTFVLGDKLVFMYRSGMQNVMEVPKEGYDKCADDKIIDWLYQGPTVLVLKSPGPHYYICYVGTHCEHGQKLFVNVSATAVPDPARDGLPPPALAPPPSSSTRSLEGAFLGLVSSLLLLVVAM